MTQLILWVAFVGLALVVGILTLRESRLDMADRIYFSSGIPLGIGVAGVMASTQGVSMMDFLSTGIAAYVGLLVGTWFRPGVVFCTEDWSARRIGGYVGFFASAVVVITFQVFG